MKQVAEWWGVDTDQSLFSITTDKILKWIHVNFAYSQDKEGADSPSCLEAITATKQTKYVKRQVFTACTSDKGGKWSARAAYEQGDS